MGAGALTFLPTFASASARVKDLSDITHLLLLILFWRKSEEVSSPRHCSPLILVWYHDSQAWPALWELKAEDELQRDDCLSPLEEHGNLETDGVSGLPCWPLPLTVPSRARP